MANTAKALLTVEVEFDPEVTDAEAIASAADRLLETALSTSDIMEDYADPKFREFYCPHVVYAIYHLATCELLMGTYGLFSCRDVAETCIREADARIADDLIIVEILGVPEPCESDEDEVEDAPPKVEVGTIRVSQEVADDMTRVCNEPPTWKNCNGKDVPLFDEEYEFSDGNRMAVQVCPDTEPDMQECWTQGVLYDENGNELGCTEVGDSFLGEYEVYFAHVIYRVTVQVGEQPEEQESL